MPFACIRECGPAAQTLAGIRKVTSRETFTEARVLAERSRVPLRTFKRHVATLATHGWIIDRGRESTRSGRARRTNTIRFTKRCSDEFRPFGIMPWWACGRRITKAGKLPWSAKVILSVVLSRLASLKAVADRGDDCDLDPDDLEETLASIRFRFPLSKLQRQTGLTRDSVIKGKRWLLRHGLVEIFGGEDDGVHVVDCIYPNWSFRVVEKPAGPGACYLSFQRGR